MTNYARGTTHTEGEINASDDDAWKLLLHWGGIMTWWPDNPPAPLLEAPLGEGETEDSLPRTRHCTFDLSEMPGDMAAGALPNVVKETLLHVDHEAKHLYYNMDGETPFGIRNYLATTDIDALSDNKCRITIRSRFDVPESVPVSTFGDMLVKPVHQAIIRGFKNKLEH